MRGATAGRVRRLGIPRRRLADEEAGDVLDLLVAGAHAFRLDVAQGPSLATGPPYRCDRCVILTGLETCGVRNQRVEARATGLLDSEYDISWE